MPQPELPSIKLDLSGRDFEATPLNSCLYTFCGQSALAGGELIDNESRNHIFLQTGDKRVNDEGNEVVNGSYVFGEAVQRIGAVMLRLQFPAELHKRRIHPNDEEAYQSYIEQQETADEIDDFFPEGWDGEA